MSDSLTRLEPFLIIARSTKGAAAAKIATDATAAAGVYQFGPLLTMPNIQELKNSDNEDLSKSFDLIELFAYGTYQDYTSAPSKYPTLLPSHILKLKQLTLVSLAMSSRSLQYNSLSSVLAIPSTRDLEDLIIDAIYAGLLAGKLTQKEGGALSVDWVVGRDVDIRPKEGGVGEGSGLASMELGDLQNRLQNWCSMASNLLVDIDQRITIARNETLSEAQHRSSYLSTRDAALSAYWNESMKKAQKSNNSTRFGGRNGYGRDKDKEVMEDMIPDAIPTTSGLESSPDQTSRRNVAHDAISATLKRQRSN